MIAGSTFLGKIAVVLPALNEESSIAKVVEAVQPFAQPIVVDDGSGDKTAELAKAAGALVVVHDHNKGYDAALESGLFHALKVGFEYAVTMDADGQHQPELVDAFKAKLAAGADLVIGKRDCHQRFAEALFSIVGRFLWGIDDPLCGMKGYRLERLLQVGHFDSYRSIGTEFVIRAAKARWSIAQIAVKTNMREGESRFGSGLGPNLRILRALVIGIILSKK